MSSLPITSPVIADPIAIEKAMEWTANWRDAKHRMRAKARAFTFSPLEIDTVIKQPGTVLVRFYLGLDIDKETGNITEKMICVGVDEKGRDMVPHLNKHGKESSHPKGEVYDFSHPCPDACDDESPLN